MRLNHHFTIAIDGPSGAGKSTIARAVAERTGALYLDTGAMYRAVALWMLGHGIDPDDASAVASHVGSVMLDVLYEDGRQKVYLDGEDVTDAIRAGAVTIAASKTSAVPAVRERLVAMQREICAGRSAVMDGRDIGTKVLPDATLKIFLVASAEERARRRYLELKAQGGGDSYESVLEAMRIRDRDDSTRAASPLKKADDAVELDSSELTLDATVERALQLLRERLDGGAS